MEGVSRGSTRKGEGGESRLLFWSYTMHGNMPILPSELGIQDGEVTQSQTWWRSLSINEMKALEAKHSVPSFLQGARHTVHKIWTKEGKPGPI